MDIISLFVKVVLKHVLSEPKPIESQESEDESAEESVPVSVSEQGAGGGLSGWPTKWNTSQGDEVNSASKVKVSGAGKKRAKTKQRQETKLGAYGIELLDFDGPKLVTGFENWLLAHKIFGQLNWSGKPLYLSIIYKSLVLALAAYSMSTRVVIGFFDLHVISDSFRNPIFLFISFLSAITLVAQIILGFRSNLFDLCPMYKILTSTKLCFLKEEVLHMIGTKTLRFTLLLGVYHGLVINMLARRNLSHFLEEFYLPSFILEVLASLVFNFHIMGLSYIDLYIRSAFGHWLLALQCYLEQRFTHLHRHQRRSQNRRVGSSGIFKSTQPLITFDEIQRNLNNMDDHLELMRSVQVSHLLLLSLNAFLGNGAIFLLSYHLLADQVNFYHGFLSLMLAGNYLLYVFFSYFGDSWLYYALGSFAQTVEDEYFMQSEIIKAPDNSNEPIEGSHLSMDQVSSVGSEVCHLNNNLLTIRKKDVLFCREFLHQFENHLATPWSKLTIISHIHLLRTFVTLIAAQIIFDHEH